MDTRIRLVAVLAAIFVVPPLAVALLPGLASAMTINLELWELTGENPAARNVYLCDCTLEQYLAVPLPGPNWQKNTTDDSTRFIMADEVVSTAPAPPAGTPATLDLIPEIPGPDHAFIARVLSVTPLGFGAQGLMINPQVSRDTILTYYAGSILHKVSDPSGTEFVLFSMAGAAMGTYDPTVVGGLAGLDLPAGWSYASEVLASELVVVTPGAVANLFGQGETALWQEIVVVPEPGTLSLLLIGVSALALRNRRRSA